jgi:acyl-homoserine lactone synthase
MRTRPRERPLAVSALMNTFRLPRFLGYGWRVRAVGWPDLHDRESLVAGTIDISPLALAGIRRACGLEERSALVRLGPHRPLILEKHDVAAIA